MDVVVTEDQELFCATTRKFLGRECPLPAVRALARSDTGFDRDFWRQGAELGWTSLLVPAEFGGGAITGAGVTDLAALAELFGAHVAPGPLLPVNVVAAALARSGTPAQQADLLAGLCAGETIAAWADPDWPGSAAPAPVTASRDGNGFVLDGRAEPVEAGAQADVLLVTARSADGPVQLVVDPHARGVTVTPLASVDLVRRYARVHFDRGARRGFGALSARPRPPPPTSTGSASSPPSSRPPRWSVPRRSRSTSRWPGCSTATRSAARWRSYQVHQAPLRRHEAVARSRPRDRGGRGERARRAGPVGTRDRERRQGVRRRPPHRARAGVRPVARRHRPHLRARPPSLPAARRRRPPDATARRPTTGCGSPTSAMSASRCRALDVGRLQVGAARRDRARRERRGLPGPGAGVDRRPPAARRSGPPDRPALPARRRTTRRRSSPRSTATAACSACSGTAASRASASPRSTAGSVSPPSTSARSTRRRRLRDPRR